jgi:hypothetical protein
MPALIAMWTTKPITGLSEPTSIATMGNMPIIAIIMPKTMPPPSPATAPAMIDLTAEGLPARLAAVALV